MQLGETLLVLGALIIFSLATLYLNDTKFDNNNTMMQTEFKITAIGIGQSFIEEAMNLQFDEVLTDTSFGGSVPSGFTDVASLGAESGESYPNFDDIDDFNGFSTNINTNRADYNVDIVVSYADSATLSSGYSSKSLLKIMTVTVKSDFFTDSLMLDYLYSYY